MRREFAIPVESALQSDVKGSLIKEMNMPKLTLLIGIALALLGVVCYSISESKSMTALIPTWMGSVLVICGVIALVKEGARKHVMHVGMLVGLLGFLGSAGRIPKALSSGEGLGLAGTSQLLTAILCIAYLVFGIRSFRAARKAREAAGE
jgi:hypothetical protein